MYNNRNETIVNVKMVVAKHNNMDLFLIVAVVNILLLASIFYVLVTTSDQLESHVQQCHTPLGDLRVSSATSTSMTSTTYNVDMNVIDVMDVDIDRDVDPSVLRNEIERNSQLYPQCDEIEKNFQLYPQSHEANDMSTTAVIGNDDSSCPSGMMKMSECSMYPTCNWTMVRRVQGGGGAGGHSYNTDGRAVDTTGHLLGVCT